MDVLRILLTHCINTLYFWSKVEGVDEVDQLVGVDEVDQLVDFLFSL